MTTSYHPSGSLQKGYPAPLYSPWFQSFTSQRAVYRLLRHGWVWDARHCLPSGDTSSTFNPSTTP
ncbi:hypothetical protein [Spirosoma fluviale]|uniref:hypothetical protein n=1 Tax=Spirosoma fluviale TaxID=1597977 RepID=UPI001181853E|nr:hypothetical protein [Spirosoma fluviale]